MATMLHCLFPAALAVLLMASPSLSTSRNVKAFPHIKTDAEALLAFKKMIDKDPNGVLSGWEPNREVCNWYGVSCSLGRATQLDLSRSNLVGTFPLYLFAYLDTLFNLNLSFNFFSVNSSSLLQLPLGLQQLDLSFTGITGTVPDGFLAKYPNLVYVNLSHNNLTGSLPENLFASINSEKLRFLDLSCNNLSGPISGLKLDDQSCKNMLHLDFSGNHLSETIPSSLSYCTNLKTLNLSFNGFTGNIPSSFGDFVGLQRLDISQNQLTGSVPADLGNACGSLLEFKISQNNISGSIPFSFVACSSLKVLDLANNNLTGPFPDSILGNLSSLESLLLSYNFISGQFPASISACNSLKIVDFSSNKLSGFIPPGICSGASSLEELRLPDNLLVGEIPANLSYCSQLKTIDLSINYLKGQIPAEFGQLKKLEHLMAWFNGLQGNIPPELGQCWNLKTLILNNNFLNGEIPLVLFNCSNLEWISLTTNQISGKIPTELGRLSRLAVLQLANNSLSGEIPRELGNCSSLVWLDLNSNQLSGTIPLHLGRQPGAKPLSGILSGNTLAFVRNVGNSCKGVGGLLEFAGIRRERLLQVPTLKTCDFTRLYSGAALSGWTQYQTLEYLDFSYNELTGKIPIEFGNMVALQVLGLSHNKITGEIPSSLGQLRQLGVFDASHNRLHGRIPESFSNLSFLVQIDLSDNALTGPIPSRGQLSTLPATQYADNPGLCGVPLQPCQSESQFGDDFPANTGTPASNPAKHHAASWANSTVLGILISVASVCVLVVWAIAMRARQKEGNTAAMLNSLQGSYATTWKIEKEKEPLSINVATFQRQLRKLTFSQLIEATNGFCAASLIGCGGFGEVFKATLKDGSSVAIKNLIRLSCQGDREFMAEMETLGKIKHRNLVPLLGYCKVGEERLLVYEFMEFGSLEEMLHGERGKKNKCNLTWELRKKIAKGAAKGLAFLHHNCIPHIIHRDMKSSNVLLDDEMEARVSDFGMARLISALDTHLSVSTLAGTPGYVPPEYYQSFRCTAKGDVYSFGVVLLELLTGKRPTDKDDFGDTNLVGWVKMCVREGKLTEVIDPELRGNPAEEEEMLQYLKNTMQCVEDFPSKRPNMLLVVAMLRELPLAVDQVET